MKTAHLSYSNSTGFQVLNKSDTKLLAHVLQDNNRFCPLSLIFLNFCTFKFLPALSALRQTHACSNSNLQPQNPWLSHFLTLRPPTSGTISPETSGTLLLSLPSKVKNSRHNLLLSGQIFQLNDNVLDPYQSLQCVYARARARACVCVCVWCVCSCTQLYLNPC